MTDERSFSSIWMPFTQMQNVSPPPVVRVGKGTMLELEDGRQVLDCISSWWVTLHGHAEPDIAAAIANQAQELEQVIAAGFTHQPAEKLARELTRRLPERSNHVFYSDNGSTAVEVALKMATQYWRNLGAGERSRFIAFEGGYHGDTVGAMSVSSRSAFTEAFEGLLFDTDFVPFPATFDGDDKVVEREHRSLAMLEEVLASGPERYAAMVIEPLVQGAAGMLVCRKEFLVELQRILRRNGVLQIYDEVLVGFGRTGAWFACQKADTTPDLVCLAKGLTGGFLPMGATVCSSEIFDAFLGDDSGSTFFHGHSYCANPLGCAAGLASIQLLESRFEKLAEIESWHRAGLDTLEGETRFERPRLCGTIAAIDLVDPDGGYLGPSALSLRALFLERGFLLRPINRAIYVIAPICIERQQMEAIYDCIGEVVRKL